MSSTNSDSRLKTWDYVSLVSVVMFASFLGLYHSFASRKQKTARTFLIRNSDLNIVAIILSLVGTFMSAIGLLGSSSEGYSNGVVFVMMGFFVMSAGPFACVFHLPVLYNLGTGSVFEYLEFRFNKFLRTCASLLFLLQLIFYSSCVIYAPALALELVVGIPLWASVLMTGVVCILYTSLGGIKTVVWMDACQVAVMIAISLAIPIAGIINLGGFSELWRISDEGRRTSFLVSSSTKESMYSTWTGSIAVFYWYIGNGCTNQMMMQRYLSNKTLQKAQISLMSGAILNGTLHIIFSLCGMVMYAYYHSCDPLLSDQVTSRDQILALYVLETTSAYEGLMGIFVASTICATLSSLSSTLNSAVVLTMEDFIRPCKPNLTEATSFTLSKILALLYGIICVGLVAVIANADGLISICMTISGLSDGPISAVFFMGMLLPWISNTGAILGFFSGFLFSGWACIGRYITKPPVPTAPMDTSGCHFNQTVFINESLSSQSLWSNGSSGFMKSFDQRTDDLDDVLYIYTLHSLWYPIWSLGIGLLVAAIVSLLTGSRNPDTVDPKLVFPIVRKTIQSLPVSFLRRLGFDIENSLYLKVDGKRLGSDELQISVLLGENNLFDPKDSHKDKKTTIS